jgi:hypothetical protein
MTAATGRRSGCLDSSAGCLLVVWGDSQDSLQVSMADYLGSSHYVGATMERAGILPGPSMAQVRQALTEYAVLPLGSQRVHEKLSTHVKSILLYGHPLTGKKMLAQAVASCTGALHGCRLDSIATQAQFVTNRVCCVLGVTTGCLMQSLNVPNKWHCYRHCPRTQRPALHPSLSPSRLVPILSRRTSPATNQTIDHRMCGCANGCAMQALISSTSARPTPMGSTPRRPSR